MRRDSVRSPRYLASTLLTMTRPALIIAGLIAIATVVLEIVLYVLYHDATDGVLPAILLLIYAAVSISFVYGGDQAVRQFRAHRKS